MIQEVAERTYKSGGLEHAIVSLKDGTRVIVQGGKSGIEFGDLLIRRVILHTHPSPTGPSKIDFDMLDQLGQKWKGDFYKLMNDSDADILFHLKEVDVWPGITRASSGRGFGATDWELLQIYQNKEWWSRIKWIDELGQEVPNPFK